MKTLQIFSLLLCFAFVRSAPNSYVDNDEQRFIDYLSTHGSHRDEVQHNDDSMDELERERQEVVRQHVSHDDKSKDDQTFHLIKKSAIAVVQRMSMPSPPDLDALIDKAAHYVMRKTMVREYAQIKSGIKELVEKMLYRKIHNEERVKSKTKFNPTSTGLREERIVLAMEELIQELAIRLNLTTLQTKKVVDISVKVLAKHLGLSPFRREELHERVTSQVRKMLDIEDEDNKDARLRRLEERIEKNIEKFKLSAKQVKKIEQLMVEEEAVEEGLPKEERARMLKRVYADVIDDLRAQRSEQKIEPPNINDVQLTAINNLIRQKAIELQLNKEEINVLGLAILTAVEHLSRNLEPTQEPQTENITTSTPTTIKSEPPTTMKTTVETTAQTDSQNKLSNEDLEKELENKKPTHRVTPHKHATELAQKTQAKTSLPTPTTHAPETERKTSQRTTTAHAHETDKQFTKKTPTAHATETEPKTSQRTTTADAHETEKQLTHKTPTAHARETEPISQRNSVKEETVLDAELLQDEAELKGKGFAKKLKMDQEAKAEELGLILERKAQDEEAKMKNKKFTMSTKVITDTTKHPDVVTKPTESHVTHKVTQATEKVTEKTKPVTQKVASVTHSKENKLSKERLEEEILEGHVPEPSKSHVTHPKSYATEVTQLKTEHVTAVKPTEDFAKELKNIIEEKPLHSRKNHELLQDEDELEDLGLIQKNKKQQGSNLEDELKLAKNVFQNKNKPKSLDEELNEVLRTKNQELKKLEDELEDLKHW